MDEEDIPSRRLDLLRSIRGALIARLTRYCWAPKGGLAIENDLRPGQVFSRAAGPLLITLESGLVIGAASQPSLISVTLWVDGARTGCDAELFAVEADDARFSEPGFAQMLGKPVLGVTVLVREPRHARWEDRPREVGVLITLAGAPELLLAHGLHDDSDDFAVLMRKDVKPSLWPRLQEVRVV